ncbi:MAG: hypothetical protein IJ268_04070 [Proteobacteria bacterium]|nr:hypothetical protein [Pseudomonadota bacterium]
MGSGKSGLYLGTKGSSSGASGTAKPQKEKTRKAAEKRKETIRKKLEAVKLLFEDGRIQLSKVKSNPKCLEKVTAKQWKKILSDLGYEDVSVAKSTHSSSGATIVKIGKQGKGNNINQVQISPGGDGMAKRYTLRSAQPTKGKLKSYLEKKLNTGMRVMKKPPSFLRRSRQ